MTKRQEPHHGFSDDPQKVKEADARASQIPMWRLIRPRKLESADNIAMAGRAENGDKQLTC